LVPFAVGGPTDAIARTAIHLMAANPHALFVEIFANRKRDPLLCELPDGFPIISDGYMKVPQEPGLGVRLRPEVIERYRVD
jgi:L-alanine-DL-glutamate epimerase-like enolase superfamily enzyme